MSKRPLDAVIRHIYRRVGVPLPDTSDHDLLTAFVTCHDEAAFAAIVQRHGSLVWGLCRRLLGDRQDVEDAFQAAFLALVRQAPAIRQRDRLGPWLYGVTLRIARRLRTAADRCRSLPPRPRPGGEPDPVEVAGQREHQQIITEELAALPAKHRDPLVLCYLQGHTHAEAAAELGWPNGSLSRRMARASELLRDRLTRRGVTLSAAALLTRTAADAAPHELTVHTVRLAGLVVAAAPGAGALPALALADAALRPAIGLKGVVAAGLMLTALGVGGVLGRSQLGTTNPPGGQKPATAAPAPPRLDNFGDPLPDGVLARIGTVRLHHAAQITGIAVTPDGRLIASTSNDGTVRVWDAASGRELHRWRAEDRTMYSIAFSPDGRRLFAGIDDELRILDPTTGQTLAVGQGHTSTVMALAVSPDGRMVATGSGDQTVRLWDAATGQPLRKIGDRHVQMPSLVFSRDGRTLAVGHGVQSEKVFFFDPATGAEIGHLPGHTKGAYTVVYSADGNLLAVSNGNGTIWLWDLATNTVRHRWDVTPDSAGRPRTYTAVAFSPDGRSLVANSYDGTLAAWDVTTGQPVPPPAAGKSFLMAVIAFSRDGRTFVAGCLDKVVRVWDVATGRPRHSWDGMVGGGMSLAFSPDGRLVATARTLSLWDVSALPVVKPGRFLEGESSATLWLAWTADGRTLVSGGRAVCFWDATTGQLLRSFGDQGKNAPLLNGLALTPDGQRYVTSACYDPVVEVRDAMTDALVHRLYGHTKPVHALALAPDGRSLVTASEDATIRLWDLDTGQERWQVSGAPTNGWWAGFTPDGRRCIIVGGGKFSVREAASGRELYSWPGGAWLVAIAPDGHSLLAREDDFSTTPPTPLIVLRELSTGAVRRTFGSNTPERWPIAPVFAPDSQRVAVGFGEGTILFWDVAPPGAAIAPAEAKELDALWDHLASSDAARAFAALCRLAAHPDRSLPLLRQRLQPVTAADPTELARLVGDLESDRFAVRQKALADLQALGERAVAALRDALARQPSLEMRLRLEQLLARFDGPVSDSETLRGLRAIEALEKIGTPEARRILQRLADGLPEATSTREAKAALGRLRSQTTGR